MAETILLRPTRTFSITQDGRPVFFRKRGTIIRADDPWFDKGGPLAGAREDFEAIRANTGGQIYGGPEPISQPAAAPAQRSPGRPKGSTAPAKPETTAA